MKLLLLGATGHVGRHVLEQALAAGHDVTALVRNPSKLTVSGPRLKVITGSVTDPDQIAAALTGQDAVISTLGHNSAKKSDVQTAATRAVLQAITPNQRFISLTGHGVPDPKDPQHPLTGRLLKLFIQLMPGEIFRDGVNHAELLHASHANWVLVRAPRIVPGPLTHNCRVGYLKISFFTTVSRADVADFMLANVTSNDWLGQAPLIAGR